VIPDFVAALGEIHELSKSSYGDEIFEQMSYYYCADVENNAAAQRLDAYEKELGYELVWADMESAYQVDFELGQSHESRFLLREAWALKYLLDESHHAQNQNA